MSSENADTVVTDLTVRFFSQNGHLSSCAAEQLGWHRIEKELYLHTAQQSAWLYIAQTNEKELSPDNLVVTNVSIRKPGLSDGLDQPWESRPGGIWVIRSKYTTTCNQALRDVDVLFGVDAVEPRPQWTLINPPLQLNAQSEVPVARLTVRRGTSNPRPDNPRTLLRAREDGKFKIVQISDTHMVTGVGVCKDRVDADGKPLPECEADPLTVDFIGRILDAENPDLVILTGDQLHHDILDSQSTLFKVVAPFIERSIPYAAVFGNHDAEGAFALSRAAQMSLLQDLPFSLSQPGPEEVAGVGNYYLQVFGPGKSERPISTIYFLDSHGQRPSKVKDPDYDSIKQSQIDWFTTTSRALQKTHNDNEDSHHPFHISLAFMHIPLPEYADPNLILRGGHRREPTEGPSFNSHFYDTLANENVAAVGCGHDHVNDFCALLPRPGPWLCYCGGTGFGGYGSYGDKRYRRRSRIWEVDTDTGGLRTWKRVEFEAERVDEVVLVKAGAVCMDDPTAQAPL